MKWAQLNGSLGILWHCPSLGLEWKLTFSNPVATAEFSKLAGILTEAPSFRIWNSSSRIPSPPLTFLSNASHSRMSDSRWVIILSWLSLKPFLYSYSVYSCRLFLVSSASVRFLPFLSFIRPSLHEIFPWYLRFSWKDLLYFLVSCFPLFLCIVYLSRPFYSLEVCIQLVISIFLKKNIYYFTLQYCISFVIHWLESSMGVHVFPILNPPPTCLPIHLPGSSQCTSPEHLVSCIKPGLAVCFTLDNIHVSMLLS